MPQFLHPSMFEEIFNAAVQSGLVGHRTALFAQINQFYVASIQNAGAPLPQLRVDLASLNSTRLADGSVPFRTWLREALALTRHLPQGQVFEKAVVELDRALAQPLGPDAAQASAALARLEREEVERLVTTGVPGRVTSIGGAPGDSFAVVEAAAKGNWLPLLVAAALARRIDDRRPDDVKLVGLARQLGLLPKVPVSGGSLERIIHKKTPFQDVAVWHARLARTMPTIARVEIRSNAMWKARGTAFLVGPDLVMTNHHVVEPLIAEADVRDVLRFRFDFQRTTDGVKLLPGTHALPIAGRDWHVLSAPPGEADLQDDPGAEPSDAELDFALVRLAEPIGDRPIGGPDAGGQRRGWLEPSADTSLDLLAEGENVFILQHPEAAPLQIAFGSFMKVGPRRVRYSTDTEPGSSGSPCLDAALRLVALHHSGDPAYTPLKRSEYNQGIPMHAIAAMCAAHDITFPSPPDT